MRLALDWTREENQHLLVVWLIIGGRATPIYWRAYDESVLKGRMRRYEMAVIKRALLRVIKTIGRKRIFITADRGFADVALFDLLKQYQVSFIVRVKASTKAYFNGEWRKLGTMRFCATIVRVNRSVCILV